MLPYQCVLWVAEYISRCTEVLFLWLAFLAKQNSSSSTISLVA